MDYPVHVGWMLLRKIVAMPDLPMLKSSEIISALKRGGFVEVRGKGSHVKMKKGGRIAVVPDHGGRDVPRGTSRSIVGQAGLTADEFLPLLKG